MSIHNIQCHDKIRKFSLNICFLELAKEFRRDSKMSSNYSHGKRAIGVRAIGVRLYNHDLNNFGREMDISEKLY